MHDDDKVVYILHAPSSLHACSGGVSEFQISIPNLKCQYPKFDIALFIPKFGFCISTYKKSISKFQISISKFEMSISKCFSIYRNDFCNIDTVDPS